MFEQEVNLEARGWSRLNFKKPASLRWESRALAGSDTYESNVPISQPREPKKPKYILSWRSPDFIDLMILVKL